VSVHSLLAREAVSQANVDASAYTVDFSSYKGGSVDEWLKAHNYQFERDARNRSLLGLSITDSILTLDAKRRMSGFILNDSVNLDKVRMIRIN